MPILVLVESPSKISKVQAFLGDEYEVMATCGHIRQLPKSELGFSIENNYEPTFEISPNKIDVVKKLRSKGKYAEKVILSCDGDFEGGSIAFHISEILNLPKDKRYRAIFTEITKKAICDSVKNTLKNNILLDMNIVYAQFARMILDKLIGYKISPLLWKEFRNYHLSAGRVQSPVVRLIAEREDEIAKFDSKSYFKLTANFVLDNKELAAKKTTKFITTECENDITKKEDVENIMNKCATKDAKFTIVSIKKSTTKRNPAPPYTTSTLQQDASSKLGMSPDVCMKNAQKLYEAGLITYMRTDAVFIAEEAIKSMDKFVCEKWGDNYFQKRAYKNKSASSQEAHEACRPTDIKRFDVSEVDGITGSHNRLYQMIWRRTLASQMASAEVEIRTVKIGLNGTEYVFVGKHEKILFEGYLAAYNYGKLAVKTAKNAGDIGAASDEGVDDDEDNAENNEEVVTSNGKNSEYLESIFAKLKEKDEVWCNGMDGCEKFTKPPHMRYTEASLIKKLDELGIGRPATYAGMVQKVQEEQRQYVEKKTLPAKKVNVTVLKYVYPDLVKIGSTEAKVESDKNKLFPTGLGIMINSYLLKHFAELMNYQFTAQIESLLDEIAAGTKVWYKVVDSVYQKLTPIIDQLAIAISTANADNTSTSDEPRSTHGRRLLGTNPANGLPIYVLRTRLGYAICESHTDKKNSRYANFTSDPESMTLDVALPLLIYPINLGQYNGHDVLIKKAKNIYITHNGKNYSIDIYNKNNPMETIEAASISLEQAITVIDSVLNATGKSAAKPEHTVNDEISVLNGRYGPYIKYKGNNIRIPAKFKQEWNTLTLVQCNVIIDNHRKKKGLKGETKGSTNAGAAADTTNAFPEATIVPSDTNGDDDDAEDMEPATPKKSVAKPRKTPSANTTKDKPKAKAKAKAKAKPKAAAKKPAAKKEKPS